MQEATPEEARGTELVNRCLAHMKIYFETGRGAKRYINVTSEGPHVFQGGRTQDHEPEAYDEDENLTSEEGP